ncbi:MAG: response regulator transcription factor [Mariprofundaceae bacterium]|nr:response regulator transcription factor [Mariprofundaceae bacterium]
MLSVLIVEDDRIIREKLAGAVELHPRLEVCAATGLHDDGLSLLEKHRPDVLLVDLGLPDGDGIDLICSAEQIGGIESIVVTVFGDKSHVIRAIKAGASGYLLKSSGVDEIGASIQEMLDGGAPISPSIARHLLHHFRVRISQPKPVLPESPLTEREMDVLTHISKGLNYNEISETLNISYHTTATHIKHIYKKMHVSSRSEAVYEAEQLGLIHIRE